MNAFIFPIYLISKIHDPLLWQEVVGEMRGRGCGGEAALQTKIRGNTQGQSLQRGMWLLSEEVSIRRCARWLTQPGSSEA